MAKASKRSLLDAGMGSFSLVKIPLLILLMLVLLFAIQPSQSSLRDPAL